MHDVSDISPLVAGARPPRAVGDAVLAAEPLRHGLGNAATAGIWRVRGPAGSAILKVARRPAGHEPARAFPTSDEHGSSDAVRATIAASGAAKYSWFAPMVAGRAARDHIGPSSYGQDSSAAAAALRVTPLVTLIADWADTAAA